MWLQTIEKAPERFREVVKLLHFQSSLAACTTNLLFWEEIACNRGEKCILPVRQPPGKSLNFQGAAVFFLSIGKPLVCQRFESFRIGRTAQTVYNAA